MNILSKITLGAVSLAALLTTVCAETKHSPTSRYPSYEGRVMTGYQGWFRTPEDGSNSGWGHYASRGKFDSENVHIDIWPDVSEYEKTYATALTGKDGQPARVFSSWDESTVNLHFRWMKDYGIDGAFVQRFVGATRNAKSRERSRTILGHAFKAAQQHDRAFAVMYDLSGLAAKNDDCSSIIQDWKELVDQLKITAAGPQQNYLYHRGKPLVAIWGVGFPDRPYNIRTIGLEKLIDFLKNDPEYGGCSVLLGVPNYFRDLTVDCITDPYLHEVMATADVIMPWMVQRFTPLLHNEMERYQAQIKADIAWCAERKLDYVPCIYPGFSWHNLSKVEFGGSHPLGQIPRQKGKFYWDQISTATEAGSRQLYFAMFDEMDEATAIFKCSDQPPVGPQLLDNEGLPSDHYLWLSGEGGRLLRKEIPFTKTIPERTAAAK